MKVHEKEVASWARDNTPRFKLWATVPTLEKAYIDEKGDRRCTLTASSTATDLVGDMMSEKELSQMQESVTDRTMFLNHKTNVPDAVFGLDIKGELVARTLKTSDQGA